MPSSLHHTKHTKHAHATRVHNTHSTVMALHTLNNTVAEEFNQMAPPCANNQCSTIIMFIANYIKERKAYTTYKNQTSPQRQLKTGVPQGSDLSPTLFNIYTANIPPHRAPVQVMAYPDDITIHIYTHKHNKPINTYNHTYIKFLPGQTKQSHTKSRQNNLYSVHSRPCSI